MLKRLHLHESQLGEEHEPRPLTQSEALDHSDTFHMLWGESVPSCNMQLGQWRRDGIPPAHSKILKNTG